MLDFCSSSPTCQRVLTLRQIEDLVKSSSFGAVISSSILVPVQTRRSCSTEVAPTPHSLNLIRWTGGLIKTATGEALAELSVDNNSPVQVCPQLINIWVRILMITKTYFVSVVFNCC